MMSIDDPNASIQFRQRLMSACAHATACEIESSLASLEVSSAVTDLRPSETGLIMLRGRIGGDGAAFNLGEATVSRAAVMLESGEIGYGYQLGRDVHKTRLSAIVDALAQRPQYAAQLSRDLLEPVEIRVTESRARLARQSAATRVNFFTMVRGDD